MNNGSRLVLFALFVFILPANFEAFVLFSVRDLPVAMLILSWVVRLLLAHQRGASIGVMSARFSAAILPPEIQSEASFCLNDGLTLTLTFKMQ